MDQVFDIWPSLAEMAADLDRPYQTVASWRRRGIPPAHDPEIIRAAARRGHDLTFEQLHEARRSLRASFEANRGAA